MAGNDPFSLDNCIKCSICVTHCPVARVSGGFAGPKQNGPDLERFRLQELTAADPSVVYCSNCKNCDLACSSGVNISAMNSRAKAEYVGRRGPGLRDRLLARVDLLGRISRISPSLVNRAGGNLYLRRLGQKILGISAEMKFPRYSGKTFNELCRSIRPAPGRNKAVYFPGCHVNYISPETGLALLKVMGRNGIEVLAGEPGCCGLPLISGGMLDQAEKLARKNVNKLLEYIRLGCPVITSCPSCNLALRQEYLELFDIRGAEEAAGKVFDVFEYLLAMLGNGELDTGFSAQPPPAAYHQPCHLRAMGIGAPSREVLGLVPGLKVTDLDAGCCGLAGSYGFRQEKYSISMEIGRDLFRAVEAEGTGRVISECGMCQLQISHGTGSEVYHPIQVLARSYGLAE